MDIFVKKNHSLSLPIMIYAHSKLSTLQVNQGFITIDDIFQSIRCIPSDSSSKDSRTTNDSASSSPHSALSSQLEVNVYTSLLIDACGLNLSNPGSFVMPKDLIANDQAFLKNLLSVLFVKTKGETSPAIEDFKIEVMNYMQINLSNLKSNSSPSNSVSKNDTSPSLRSQTSTIPGDLSLNSSIMNSHQTSPSLTSQNFSLESQALNSGLGFDLPQSSYYDANSQLFNQAAIPKPNEPDPNDPMVKFLAIIRKEGQDVVFPLGSQDKMLAAIFVAVNVKSFSAMRDLIDITMVVKDSQIISQVEHVSKTKIRGILALLKQSGLLVTQIIEGGKTVRLVWAPGISNFGELRDRHDAYVNRLLTDNRIPMPIEMKSELVWMFDFDAKRQRLEMLDMIVGNIYKYLITLPGFNHRGKAVNYQNQQGYNNRNNYPGPMQSQMPNPTGINPGYGNFNNAPRKHPLMNNNTPYQQNPPQYMESNRMNQPGFPQNPRGFSNPHDSYSNKGMLNRNMNYSDNNYFSSDRPHYDNRGSQNYPQVGYGKSANNFATPSYGHYNNNSNLNSNRDNAYPPALYDQNNSYPPALYDQAQVYPNSDTFHQSVHRTLNRQQDNWNSNQQDIPSKMFDSNLKANMKSSNITYDQYQMLNRMDNSSKPNSDFQREYLSNNNNPSMSSSYPNSNSPKDLSLFNPRDDNSKSFSINNNVKSFPDFPSKSGMNNGNVPYQPLDYSSFLTNNLNQMTLNPSSLDEQNGRFSANSHNLPNSDMSFNNFSSETAFGTSAFSSNELPSNYDYMPNGKISFSNESKDSKFNLPSDTSVSVSRFSIDDIITNENQNGEL